MQAADRETFDAVLADAQEAIGQGQPYTVGALDLMFAALAEFDLKTIQQALVDHINSPDGKWRPNASYIRAQIDRRAGALWITADEAWARIPKPAGAGSFTRLNDKGNEVRCRDYRGTEWPAALLNQVTTEALAVAGPLLEAGDESAARMAFRACYNRRVEEEKAAGRAPQYRVSGGSHEDQQVLIEQGVAQGMLPAPAAAPQLSYSAPPPGALEALRNFHLKTLPPPEEE